MRPFASRFDGFGGLGALRWHVRAEAGTTARCTHSSGAGPRHGQRAFAQQAQGAPHVSQACDPFESLEAGACGREARDGRGGEHRSTKLLELGVGEGSARTDRAVTNRPVDRDVVLRIVPKATAGGELLEDRAGSEEIDSRARTPTLELLGREVPQRPFDEGARGVLGEPPGHAEVGELDLAGGADQDVSRGHVAMEQTPEPPMDVGQVVGVLQSSQQLGENVRGDLKAKLRIELREGRAQTFEVEAVDELEHQEVATSLSTVLAHGHDVGVHEFLPGRDFASEEANVSGCSSQRPLDELDGDRARHQAGVTFGKPDFGHATRAERVDQTIRADAKARRQGGEHERTSGTWAFDPSAAGRFRCA